MFFESRRVRWTLAMTFHQVLSLCSVKRQQGFSVPLLCTYSTGYLQNIEYTYLPGDVSLTWHASLSVYTTILVHMGLLSHTSLLHILYPHWHTGTGHQCIYSHISSIKLCLTVAVDLSMYILIWLLVISSHYCDATCFPLMPLISTHRFPHH